MTTITLPRATVEQALEALEAMQSYAAAERKGLRICDEAITALRAALAQQAEPVPFGCVTVRRLSLRHENHADQYQFYPAGQSPYLDNVDECHTVYTAPPQRKPLSEEEILHVKGQFRGTMNAQFVEFARAIEKAHGIGGRP